MRYEDEWVSRTPIVRPPVGVQLLVPVAAEFLATEGDLEAILSLGFVTAAAESEAVSTNAMTLRRLVGPARARMQGRHAKLDTRLLRSRLSPRAISRRPRGHHRLAEKRIFAHLRNR